MNAEDVTKILNLKHSWNFILDRDVLSYPTNYAILCQINHLVEEGISTLSGHIRRLPVSIGGSTYIPPIPLEYQVKEELNEFLSKDISIDTEIMMKESLIRTLSYKVNKIRNSNNLNLLSSLKVPS